MPPERGGVAWMQWYSHAYELTLERLTGLTPRARWVAVVVLLLLGVLIVLVSTRRPRSEVEFLFGCQTFSRAEITAMESALAKAGLSESDVVGNRLRIPRLKKDLYLKALAAGDALPGGFDPGWDAYVPENPFSSREVVEQKAKHAHLQKLARIVQGMNGIESATVNYDEMKKAGFPPTIEKRSVAVVRAVEGRHLTFDQVEAIRDTVAGYISGLDRRMVTVTDLNAVRAYPGNLESMSSGQQYTTLQWIQEKAFREKILSRLAMYPGVVVGVNVHLQPAMIALNGIEARETPVGHSSHANTASPLPVSEAAAIVPVLVTASIDMPQSYFLKVWRERHPTAEQDPAPEQLLELERETKQTVQRAVTAMLPPPATHWAAIEQVTVTTYADVPRPGAPSSTAELDEREIHAMLPWALLAVTGILAMIATCRNHRRNRTARIAGHDEQSAAVVDPQGTQEASAVASHERTAPSSDTDSRAASNWQQELLKTVQQDPAGAVKVLHRWIKDAA
jgi:flagellar biosynthesis/type III secretory pathway M-ring protein FliF/YscJ